MEVYDLNRKIDIQSDNPSKNTKINAEIFHKFFQEKEAKQREINNNLRMKKDAEFRKKQKRLRELESMGVSEGNLGQGELFKF